MKSGSSQICIFCFFGPSLYLCVDSMSGLENHSKRYQKALKKKKKKPSETSKPHHSRAKQSPDSWSADPVPECFVTLSRSFDLSGFRIAQWQRGPRHSCGSFHILRNRYREENKIHSMLSLFCRCKSRIHFAVQKYPGRITQALTWLSSLEGEPAVRVQASHIQLRVDFGNQGIFLWPTALLWLFIK